MLAFDARAPFVDSKNRLGDICLYFAYENRFRAKCVQVRIHYRIDLEDFQYKNNDLLMIFSYVFFYRGFRMQIESMVTDRGLTSTKVTMPTFKSYNYANKMLIVEITREKKGDIVVKRIGNRNQLIDLEGSSLRIHYGSGDHQESSHLEKPQKQLLILKPLYIGTSSCCIICK